MTIMRLIADDLTGALDTAAEFVPLTGPVSVYWNESLPKSIDGSAAFDSGTREKSETEAAATLVGMSSYLASADIAYKKIDSLLRGHTMAELAACLRCELWDRCIVAPAFPHQGRITSGGVQFRVDAGEWVPVADLVALLAEAGISALRGSTDAVLPPGVNVFDAATDDDLRRVARVGRSASGRVLWCGSAGLAQALANGTEPMASPVLKRPVLDSVPIRP
jgi:D-threonate/D-erythronate kinase